MKTFATAIFSLLAASCANTPATPTADQIAALPSGSVMCSVVIGPWGTGKVTYARMDETAKTNGTLTSDEKCNIGMSSTKPVPSSPTVKVP